MGFLPWKTTTGDRIFYAVAVMIAIGLVWLRFVERDLSLWWALLLSILVGFVMIRYG